jgi:lysophospholipase L1-like esterase
VAVLTKVTVLTKTTAVAAGCFGGLGTAIGGLLFEQSVRARRAIALPSYPALRADGTYLPDGSGPIAVADQSGITPLRLAVLGDSSAAGFGAVDTGHLPGVLVARSLAEEAERPVRLDTYAGVGCTSRDLARQAQRAAANTPDVVVILVGANDVTKRLHPRTSAALLAAAVSQLRACSAAVVVGTCPDLGVIRAIPQPLRGLLHAWSLTLARLQHAAVRRAGGHPVPMAELLAAEFLSRADYFYSDRFHPSDAGYEATAAVLLPAVCAALGL